MCCIRTIDTIPMHVQKRTGNAPERRYGRAQVSSKKTPAGSVLADHVERERETATSNGSVPLSCCMLLFSCSPLNPTDPPPVAATWSLSQQHRKTQARKACRQNHME